MSSDEGELNRYEENLFADEAEVSGSDHGGSGDERSGGGGRNGIQPGSDEDKEKNDQKDEKKAKPKVKRPPGQRTMLSEDTLCGKNGLIKVEETFKDFKFEGRGREKQDLDRLLHKIELWVHVLHPRNPFEQTLERIEWLGVKKKSVKTHVKKIRMGLISNIEPVDEANLPDFENSDDEGNKETTETETNDSERLEIPAPALPIQIQDFGFNDSEDEDDFLLASIMDPTMPIPATNDVNLEVLKSSSNSAKNLDDINMDIDDEGSVHGVDVLVSRLEEKQDGFANLVDEGLLIDEGTPKNSISNNSDEIEDMLLDEESQIISSNEAVKSVEPKTDGQTDKNVILVDDDEFDRLMAEVGM